MIRPFLSKALQPPEEQAVINALEVLRQLVSMLCYLPLLLFSQKSISASYFPSIFFAIAVNGSNLHRRVSDSPFPPSYIPWKDLLFTFLLKKSITTVKFTIANSFW